MRKKKYTPDERFDFIVLITLVVMVLILLANSFRNNIERSHIDIVKVEAEETELSVQPKEVIMYHEYTPEELAEQEYDDSLELLAICVEAEAGNQDFLDKRLVVDVILNRVDSPDFPNDITSVITQPYQFTSYSDGNMDKVWEASEETYEAVRTELKNRTDSEILYFTEGQYNPYCTPAYKHGDHYFGY